MKDRGSSSGQPGTQDRWQTIYTREGWSAYVNAPTPVGPRVLKRDEYEALEEAARRQYDFERRKYIMNSGPIMTPAVSEALGCARGLLEANILAPVNQVKTGIVIDGHANLGKTTVATVVARQFERWIRKEENYQPVVKSRDLFLPVVHLTLLHDTSPKSMAEAICKYLGVPLRGRETESQLVDAIFVAVQQHDIKLFVVDDIHFLRVRSKNGQETSNFMKSLMTLTGATFIHVGVDVEQMGFLQEHGAVTLASSQTASRFIHIPIRPFDREDQDWRALIDSVEARLPLLDHEPGSLGKLYRSLYDSTGGMMGSFMHLVRTAAFRAVGRAERLDRAGLTSVRRDYLAETTGNWGEL